MPLQLAAAGEQPLPELHRLEEPLPAGHDLERTVALLVELHRVRDGAWISKQIAGFAQQLDDPDPRLGRRQIGELVVGRLRSRRVARFPTRIAPCHRTQRAVGHDERAHRQRQLPPPGHVGEIAERADHGDATALFRIRKRVGFDRHRHAEERRHHLGPEERLVPLVVWMCDERDARRHELRPRGLDLHGAAVRPPEPQPVIRARLLAILELGLGDRGAEVDVPQRRRFELVDDAACQQPQERGLRDLLRAPVDRGVGTGPVHREAEVLPQVLERLLVFSRQPIAQLDEVRAGDGDRLLARLLGRLECRVVWQ
jgi:hypothetical protein